MCWLLNEAQGSLLDDVSYGCCVVCRLLNEAHGSLLDDVSYGCCVVCVGC